MVTSKFYDLGTTQCGFVFVNVNYRLAPEVTFPSELNDVNRYIHWICHHTTQYQLE